MKNKKLREQVKSYIIVTLACVLYALSFDWFYAPNGFTVGGFTGISQIINFFAPILPVGTMVIVLNVPLFIVGLKKFGFAFLCKSIYTMTLSSILIDVVAAIHEFAPMDPLLACLYGGVTLGIASGLLFREETTTGGSELGAWIVRSHVERLSIGNICLGIDLTIILIYAAVFRSLNNALYGALALYITTKVLDLVVYGQNTAKVAYIISDKYEEIMQGRLHGRGASAPFLCGAQKGGCFHQTLYQGTRPRCLFHRLRRERGARRGLWRIRPAGSLRISGYKEDAGMDLTTVEKNLEERGFKVSAFATAKEAADYLNAQIDGESVSFGGSMTLSQMGLFESLGKHNTMFSHWNVPDGMSAAEVLQNASTCDNYLLSADGLAETGEIINIDGTGNRVSSSLYGHKRVWFVVGSNKIAPTYDEALWRARNIAAPKNAQRLGVKTPCAVNGDRCYDCKSPQRICRGLVVLWEAIRSCETEVVLVDEPLGY